MIFNFYTKIHRKWPNSKEMSFHLTDSEIQSIKSNNEKLNGLWICIYLSAQFIKCVPINQGQSFANESHQ